MRALVTGSGGFVGGHLVAHLRAEGDSVVCWSGDRDSPDVTDLDQVRAGLDGLDVDVVFHLAGQSHVGRSWEQSAATMAINAGGTANLLDALAANGARPRVVVMSSAEVYGRVDPQSVPVVEEAPLEPRTPYGASKIATEQLALLLGERHGIDVVVCRPFNQIGPGQSCDFVAGAFAEQIARNERVGGGQLLVGNLSATRDFLDVRDAVVAHRLLAIHGVAGEAYNVAGGTEVAVQQLLDGLLAHSRVDQTVVTDPERFRPNDLPRMFASIDKVHSVTGWSPARSFTNTLRDILDDWRDRIATETP